MAENQALCTPEHRGVHTPLTISGLYTPDAMKKPIRSSQQQVTSWRNGLGRRTRSFERRHLIDPGSNPSRGVAGYGGTS